MLPPGLQSPQAIGTPLAFSKLLLVEGRDAFNFFKGLLQHLNLLEAIEIRNFGGIDELSTAIKTPRVTDGFENIHSIGIIRDAESDAQKAFQAIQRDLKKAHIDVPLKPIDASEGIPKVSIFILPDCTQPGMLETLCMDAVRDDPVIPCIDAFFACMQSQGISSRNDTKARLHAFLASRSPLRPLFGQAALEGYFPWESNTFNSLRDFLQRL